MDELEIATVRVTGVHAQTVRRLPIPAGIVGAQVRILYDDPMWAGMHKTVVFKGAVTKDVITDADTVTIPAEVVARPGVLLMVGIYGVDCDGNLAIPTLWADLGTIRDGADPSGDATTDPSLPVWARLRAMIGNLDELDTTAKNNLVAAVNEAMTKGGEVDEAEIQRIVEEYLAANPPQITETDPTVPTWAKKPQKPTYTAEEVGAMSAETLPAAINTALAQAKDSGEFDGSDGSDGGYYAPSVSQPNANTMTVSFAPSQDGMPAVPKKTVTLPAGPAGPTGATPNIKIGTVETLAAGSSATASMDGTPENPKLNLGIPQGAAGQDGNTPVKGKDYFTEADKAELVNSVLSALPAAEGVNY